MNKKGQLDPYTIGGAIIGIILLLILPGIISDITCQDERENIERLTKQLSTCQGSAQETNQALINCENQLTQISEENNNLKEKLTQLQKDLDICQSSKEYFPIFWITNISLTKEWILLLNISLGISIISIFNILRWLYSSNKKKKI